MKVSFPNVSSELQNVKRHLLRIVASIFDPLELVSLIFITGKELLQTLWFRGYQWDDVIEEKRPPLVSAGLDQLISQGKVPRCRRMIDSITSFNLVTVVDSCEIAHGAAVYATFEYEL